MSIRRIAALTTIFKLRVLHKINRTFLIISLWVIVSHADLKSEDSGYFACKPVISSLPSEEPKDFKLFTVLGITTF